MVIKTAIHRFPESDIQLSLGDKEVRIASIDFDNSKRLKRIEEEQAKGSTFVTESKDLPHIINSSRRDIRVNQQDYTVGIGYSIWGLGTADGFFDWGSGKWGTHSDAFDAEVEHTINQTNNVYDENFNDDDYLDSGNTTATWSGNGSVSFTSGQVAQSKTFLLNDITVVSLIITPTVVSGSFTYQIDTGSGFETVTTGSRVFLTNSGTSVKFKITESAASTGSLSNLKIEVFP